MGGVDGGDERTAQVACTESVRAFERSDCNACGSVDIAGSDAHQAPESEGEGVWGVGGVDAGDTREGGAGKRLVGRVMRGMDAMRARRAVWLPTGVSRGSGEQRRAYPEGGRSQ